MSEQPQARTDRVEKAIDTLLWQYRKSPVMAGVAASHAVQAQELESVFVAIWVGYMLPTSEGAQLDVLGLIVGEKRLQRSDDTYRIAISARIKTNRSKGVVEDILETLSNAKDYDYWLTEQFPASMNLQILESIDEDTAEGLHSILTNIKGGGIAASTTWTKDINTVLKFASGEEMEYAYGLGLADEAETRGGLLAGYKND